MLGRLEEGPSGARGLAIGASEVDENVEPRADGKTFLVTFHARAVRALVDDVFTRAGCIGNLDGSDTSPVIMQLR